MADKVNVKVVTGEVRLSYVTLFEPRAIAEGGDLKYSVVLLIPKTDKKTIKEIQDGIQKVIDGSQGILKTKKEAMLKLPLRDGDEEKDSPEYEGHYFITASNKQKPIVVDENGKEIITATREVYSGCYGRVSFTLFPFNTAGNKGVGVSLNAVKKTDDGEPLGGMYTAAEAANDFGDEDEMDLSK